jgi:fluoroacetyl-CoA thioesterase
MEGLKAGLNGKFEWKVTQDLCTERGGYHVFSTPSMVLLVERTAMRVIEPYLQPEQSSVGTRIDIRHLAPTLMGMSMRAEAELVSVDRRRLGFKVKVFDEAEQVGEADHERFVIELEKYIEKLKLKAEA